MSFGNNLFLLRAFNICDCHHSAVLRVASMSKLLNFMNKFIQNNLIINTHVREIIVNIDKENDVIWPGDGKLNS